MRRRGYALAVAWLLLLSARVAAEEFSDDIRLYPATGSGDGENGGFTYLQVKSNEIALGVPFSKGFGFLSDAYLESLPEQYRDHLRESRWYLYSTAPHLPEPVVQLVYDAFDGLAGTDGSIIKRVDFHGGVDWSRFEHGGIAELVLRVIHLRSHESGVDLEGASVEAILLVRVAGTGEFSRFGLSGEAYGVGRGTREFVREGAPLGKTPTEPVAVPACAADAISGDLTWFVAASDLPKGTLITTMNTRKQRLVSPGEAVQIVVSSGTAAVELDGVSLGAGGYDDPVDVRVSLTGAVVRGRASGTRSVDVSFE